MQVPYAHRLRAIGARGATVVEYAILVALVAVISIAVIAALGEDVLAVFTGAEEQFPHGPKSPTSGSGSGSGGSTPAATSSTTTSTTSTTTTLAPPG